MFFGVAVLSILTQVRPGSGGGQVWELCLTAFIAIRGGFVVGFSTSFRSRIVFIETEKRVVWRLEVAGFLVLWLLTYWRFDILGIP